MNRRSLLLAGLGATIAIPAAAATQPWSARLLKGGFDGSRYWTGLHVSLEEGWKTYWRIPGDGGIAPQIDVKGANLKSALVSYPLPTRYKIETGEAIGYKHEVVFPIALEVRDSAMPLNISLSSFIGVCDIVCIPAQFDGAVDFIAARADAPDQPMISTWLSKAPKLVTDKPVKSASAILHQGEPHLRLLLTEPVNDIFVEGETSHYFQAPILTKDTALIKASGAKSLKELKGTSLRITCDVGNHGLEQLVTVG